MAENFDEGKLLLLSSFPESKKFHRMLSKMFEVSGHYPHDTSRRSEDYLDRPLSKKSYPNFWNLVLEKGLGPAIYDIHYSKLACIFRHHYLDSQFIETVESTKFYKLINNQLLKYFGEDFGIIVFQKKHSTNRKVSTERKRCIERMKKKKYPHFILNYEDAFYSENIFDLYEFLGFPRTFENGQEKFYYNFINDH